MCGLFGFSTYQEKVAHDLTKLTNSLALQSSIRGSDATGVAFCSGGHVQIHKEAAPAHKLKFTHPCNIRALIGHTRHTTQGSEKQNRNNHPFSGRVPNTRFALAHNGVLSNDDRLQKQYKLPQSKIETDSYVAVQLIEHQKELTFDSLRFMAEAVSGSFSFSILDDQDNVYLVKGDSPLSTLHFPHEKIYVFASTDEILYRSLIDSPLFKALKGREYEEVPITCGTILKICPNGKLETESFHFSHYVGRSWWEYGGYSMHESSSTGKKTSMRDAYVEELKIHAAYMGLDPDMVDALLDEGFTFDELEDYIYGYVGC
jgi:predicted glutamine amidotransferase